MYFDLLIVLTLILINGYLAMAELALLSARKARLNEMANEGVRGAKAALRLLEDPTKLLSTVQTGITVCNVLAAAFSGATVAEHLGKYLDTYSWIAPNGEAIAFTAVIIMVSYVTLLLGELVPKRIAVTNAEAIACSVARILSVISVLAAPAVWFMKASTDACLKLLGMHGKEAAAVTTEEVKFMIAEGAESGAIDPAEKQMLDGVMRLTDRTVRTIMTPRVDMTWLDLDEPAGVALSIIKKSHFSRFPVARGDLEEVTGIVHAKDLLARYMAGETIDLKTAQRPALIVPDTTPVLRLLEQFKRKSQYFAVVIDEYGTVEGVVSVTDILAAIAGDIPQQGDTDSSAPFKRPDGTWLLDGLMPIDEVESLFDLRDLNEDEDFHTLAGFFIARLGRLPRVGDVVEWQDHRFEIVDMDGRRVDKVLVTVLPKVEPIDE